MTPRISVVVPAYNNASYIGQTLDSVLGQTFGDFEVVIADHSSVDATAEVIEGYRGDPRMRILPPTPPGGGARANWNRVSEHARGEWIKLVCGDDLLAPEALARQLEAAEQHPAAVMVASQRTIIDANGAPVFRSRGLAGLSGAVPGTEAIRRTVRRGTNIFGEPACVLLRRDALERSGWDDSFPYMLDVATYAHIMHLGDVVALPGELASFRLSASQWSVRLANYQAAQAAGFHKALRAQYPTLLSAADVYLGNARARLNAYARRLVYFGIRKRMGHQNVVESTT